MADIAGAYTLAVSKTFTGNLPTGRDIGSLRAWVFERGAVTISDLAGLHSWIIAYDPGFGGGNGGGG